MRHTYTKQRLIHKYPMKWQLFLKSIPKYKYIPKQASNILPVSVSTLNIYSIIIAIGYKYFVYKYIPYSIIIKKFSMLSFIAHAVMWCPLITGTLRSFTFLSRCCICGVNLCRVCKNIINKLNYC